MPRPYSKRVKGTTLQVAFDAKWTPEPNTGCWLWTAATTSPHGYGVLWYDGHLDMAHRVSWRLHRGEIPDGMHIDHVCRVRTCVNPDHLRVVTPRINAIENSVCPSALNAAKTHCPRGHLYDRTRRDGHKTSRVCRVCRNAAEARRKALRRVA